MKTFLRHPENKPHVQITSSHPALGPCYNDAILLDDVSSVGHQPRSSPNHTRLVTK